MSNIKSSFIRHSSTILVQSWPRAAAVAVALLATISVPSATAELIYGITNQGSANTLVWFDSASPGSLNTTGLITGLQPNETILGVDGRVTNLSLYGMGSTSRLYVIDRFSGAATVIGAQFPTLINGSSFGVDFNPVNSRIRVVSDTNQNFILEPDASAMQTLTPNVAYAAGDANFGVDPNVVGSAYTNNNIGVSSTTLYAIDSGLDILATQDTATGALTTVGPLGLNIDAAGGFDVSNTGVAYAAVLSSGGSQSSLYRINLATGAATSVGQIGGGVVLSALAVWVPEPTSMFAWAFAAAALISVRPRKD